MLIYKLLGDKAQSEFARSWGVSYGMNAATEWKDIAVEAVKATIILIIMERLFLTRNSAWLEEHMDYLSIVRMKAHAAAHALRRADAHAPAAAASAAVQARWAEHIPADVPLLPVHQAAGVAAYAFVMLNIADSAKSALAM